MWGCRYRAGLWSGPGWGDGGTGAVVFVIANANVVFVNVVLLVIVAAVKKRTDVGVVVRAARALVRAQEKMCLEMMVSPSW